MAIPRRAVGPILAAVLLVGACQAEGRTFSTMLPTVDRDPLPVALTDETELVTGIDEAQADVSWGDKAAVHALPGRPNAVVLSWLGGVCDRDARVRFHVVNGDYLLNLAINEPGGSCPAAGVPRALRIDLSRSIPAESVVVAGGPP